MHRLTVFLCIFPYLFLYKYLRSKKKCDTILCRQISYEVFHMEEKENVTATEQETNHLPPKITKETLASHKNVKHQQTTLWIKAILYTMLSALLVAVPAYALIAPNDFTIGGVSGIAILLNVASNGKIPQSYVLFGLNLPLVVTSFFIVKKRFAILSALNITMQSIWLLIIEQLFKGHIEITFPGGEASKIFAAIAAGICIGVAIGLAFKVGGSTGGADIIAVMIQKKIAATSIAWMMFIINCIIIGASVLVFRQYDENGNLVLGATLLPIALSAFESYLESKTNESLTNGFQSAIEFRIITDKPDEMAHALMKELSRGVTSLPATGMYTKETHSMLVCVVSRRQVATLQRGMKTVDPDSFAVMSKVSQVLGLGFYTSEL